MEPFIKSSNIQSDPVSELIDAAHLQQVGLDTFRLLIPVLFPSTSAWRDGILGMHLSPFAGNVAAPLRKCLLLGLTSSDNSCHMEFSNLSPAHPLLQRYRKSSIPFFSSIL